MTSTAAVRAGVVAALRADKRPPWPACDALQVVASLQYAQEQGLILARDGTVWYYSDVNPRMEFVGCHAAASMLDIEYVEARMLFIWCHDRYGGTVPRKSMPLVSCKEFAELLDLYFGLGDPSWLLPVTKRGKSNAKTDNATAKGNSRGVQRHNRRVTEAKQLRALLRSRR